MKSPLEDLIQIPGARVLNYEPSLMLTLDENCRLQCRLSLETRTNAYQVRTGQFPEAPISVYFTVRQYGSLSTDTSYESTLRQLRQQCEQLLERYVIDQVLKPLQQAMSTK